MDNTDTSAASPTEVQRHVCAACGYVARNRHALSAHMIWHKRRRKRGPYKKRALHKHQAPLNAPDPVFPAPATTPTTPTIPTTTKPRKHLTLCPICQTNLLTVELFLEMLDSGKLSGEMLALLQRSHSPQ